MVSLLKGEFRLFMVTSLQNYLSDETDSARCLKRGGNMEFVHLDTTLAEDRYRLAPLDYLTAEKIFDARWAMTFLDGAIGRLREEYAAQGRNPFSLRRPDRSRRTIRSMKKGDTRTCLVCGTQFPGRRSCCGPVPRASPKNG
jgi:hypothetical protein